jgi:hypothetical protein
MKKARQKFFMIRHVAEIPNLCCEQARPSRSALGNRTPAPAVSHLEAEKSDGGVVNGAPPRFVIF